MIKITRTDFDKLVQLLKKEGMDGASLTFAIPSYSGAMLQIVTVDRSNKEITIELADEAYPFMPRVTRTETF
jgi:hypothetical protein